MNSHEFRRHLIKQLFTLAQVRPSILRDVLLTFLGCTMPASRTETGYGHVQHRLPLISFPGHLLRMTVTQMPTTMQDVV